MRRLAICLSLVWLSAMVCAQEAMQPEGGALAGERLRAFVSTDAGGTDEDDIQSIVHLLLYADVLDLEGIISSPYGPGRVEHILEVVDAYEKDYENLKTWSDGYPTPDEIRAITKQGALVAADETGVPEASEGVDFLIECANRDDPRPLHVLVWGGIDDISRALHDDPSIKEKIRVHWVAGPNKKWGANTFNYLITNHPDLWIIESNTTYCGFFAGGDQTGDLANKAFVEQHVLGHGALGDVFGTLHYTGVKMGDSPTVGWLLRGNPADPTAPSWGGRYRPVERRWRLQLDRFPNDEDTIEVFGVVEMTIKAADVEIPEGEAAFHYNITNQHLAATKVGPGLYRVRHVPKAVRNWEYNITSDYLPELDGQGGTFTSVQVTADTPEELLYPQHCPNWWTDVLDPDEAVMNWILGANTVAKWREGWLRDFQARLKRAAGPKP